MPPLGIELVTTPLREASSTIPTITWLVSRLGFDCQHITTIKCKMIVWGCKRIQMKKLWSAKLYNFKFHNFYFSTFFHPRLFANFLYFKFDKFICWITKTIFYFIFCILNLTKFSLDKPSAKWLFLMAVLESGQPIYFSMMLDNWNRT